MINVRVEKEENYQFKGNPKRKEVAKILPMWK
jgi:hypothetical protein